MRPGYLHGPFSRLLRQLGQFFDLVTRHPDPDVAADQPDGRRYDALPEENTFFAHSMHIKRASPQAAQLSLQFILRKLENQ